MTDRITFPSNTVGRPNSIPSYAVNLPFRLNQRRHVNGKRVNNSASKKKTTKKKRWESDARCTRFVSTSIRLSNVVVTGSRRSLIWRPRDVARRRLRVASQRAPRSRRGRVVNTWTTWCNKRRRRTTEYFIKYVNSRPRPAQLNNNYDAEKPQRRRIQHNTCQLNRSTTQIEFRLRVVAIAAHRVRDRHTACLYVPNTPCTYRRTATIPPLPYDAVNGDCMI